MTKHCQTHYAVLPANDIFGMVGRCGGGYNSIWVDWSLVGRQKRKLIMEEYEQGLDAICGHYSKLEKSILEEGIRNPIIITCGLPKKRPIECLPPEMRNLPESQLLLLESTTGGSRLHIAQKYNMQISCIVNDWTERFSLYPKITKDTDTLKYYKDCPSNVKLHHRLGIVESFDEKKVGYHLGHEWSEEKLMPLRAPLWIGIMNKHGYQIHNLPAIVLDVLGKAGMTQ